MALTDKPDECGCHRGCTMTAHPCTAPCVWPNCLTEDEHAQLLAELAREGL